MAIKLSKTQAKEIAGFHESLTQAWSDLEDETTAAQEKIAAILEELKEHRATYEGKRADAANYAREIVDELQGEVDDKSERWQESERGEELSNWVSELESLVSEAEAAEAPELDEIVIEMPDDVSHCFAEESWEAPEA
jgi:flagellar motility protein MotE (MotC chaperone)